MLFIFSQQAISKPIPPGSGEGDVPANILILLDSSASMQRQIVSGDSLGFPHAVAADSNGDVYIGTTNGLGKYEGYQDGSSAYRFRYFSPDLSFNAPEKLKMLKILLGVLLSGKK